MDVTCKCLIAPVSYDDGMYGLIWDMDYKPRILSGMHIQVINAGCQIITPPKFYSFFVFLLGGVSIPIANSWSAFLESKLLLMKSACCFEKGFALLCFLQTSENKTWGSTIGSHYCHAWCRFIIAILGLAKGIPFADLFSCFFFK